MTAPHGTVESKASTAIVLASDYRPVIPAIDCRRQVTVIGKPHPLRTEVVQCFTLEGLTIAQVLQGLDPSRLEVRINGEFIPSTHWGLVKPRAGTVLEVLAFPQGGNTGKIILGAVAALAIAFLTYGAGSGLIAGWLGAGAGSFFAAGGTGAALAAAAISTLGALALSALIKPTLPEVDYNQSGTAAPQLTGIGNRATPYGVVPLVIGSHVVYPTLAASVFSMTEGEHQYMNLLFDFGMGDMDISLFKFGDTDIATFASDAVYEIAGPGVTPRLYRNDVYEGPVNNIFVNANEVRTVTTQNGTDEIGVEINFPGGLYGINDKGEVYGGVCKLRIRYKSQASPTWINSSAMGELLYCPVPGSDGFVSWDPDRMTQGTGADAGVWIINSSSQNPFTTGITIVTPPDSPSKTFDVEMTYLISDFNKRQKSFSITYSPNFPARYPTPYAPVPATPYYDIVFEPDSTISVVTTEPVTVRVQNPGSRYSTPLVQGVDYTITGAAGNVIRFTQEPTARFGTPLTINVSYVCTDTQSRTKAQTPVWTVLRSTSYVSPSTTQTNKVAMKLRASDELKGNVNQLSALVSQRVHVWDGVNNATNHELWPLQFSTNPAWIFYWLLTECPANPRPVDQARIDLPTIYSWAQDCIVRGFTFSTVLDTQTTLGQIIMDVCAAGRATFTQRDGKYSVVRDTQQITPVQHFTPRNSSGFSGVRAFPDMIHGLRCKFRNPLAGYQEDERVVYDAGYSEATPNQKLETLELRGVTDPSAVWRLAKYHLAAARLRQNEYTWKTDIEHLVCQRGDLVKMNHDVVRWGSGYARIKSLTGGIFFDDLIELTPGTYTLRVRTQTGASVTASCTYVAPGQFSGTLAGASVGDLVMIGTAAGTESVNLIVTKIVPGADMSATITAVDEAPGVYTADSGAIPGFVSAIAQGYAAPPNPPTIQVIYPKNIPANQLQVDVQLVVTPGQQLSRQI